MLDGETLRIALEEDRESVSEASGVRFGRYRLDRELGRGGMGIVYQARDPDDRVVALKVSLAGRDHDARSRADRRARFEREAKRLAELDHSSIPSVHDFGEQDGLLFLACDLLEGPSLHRAIADGITLEAAAAAVRDAALATQHAHDLGILHRDIKPDNIIVTEDRAYLVDFGLAKAVDGSEQGLTRTGQLVGTFAFLAPEQIDPVRWGEVGPATDVRALGACIVFAITRAPPFPGRAPRELMRQIIAADPARLRDLAPGVPDAIDLLCARALARDPSDRPKDAAEVAAFLDGWLDAGAPGADEVRRNADAKTKRLPPGRPWRGSKKERPAPDAAKKAALPPSAAHLDVGAEEPAPTAPVGPVSAAHFDLGATRRPPAEPRSADLPVPPDPPAPSAPPELPKPPVGARPERPRPVARRRISARITSAPNAAAPGAVRRRALLAAVATMTALILTITLAALLATDRGRDFTARFRAPTHAEERARLVRLEDGALAGDAEVLALLVAIAGDSGETPTLRSGALDLLRRTRAPSIAAELTPLAADESDEVRKAAVYALVACGGAEAKPLIDGAEMLDADPRAIDALAAVARDRYGLWTPDERVRVCRRLGRRPRSARGSLDELLAVVADAQDHAEVRCAAVDAADAIDPDAALEPLIECLRRETEASVARKIIMHVERRRELAVNVTAALVAEGRTELAWTLAQLARAEDAALARLLRRDLPIRAAVLDELATAELPPAALADAVDRALSDVRAHDLDDAELAARLARGAKWFGASLAHGEALAGRLRLLAEQGPVTALRTRDFEDVPSSRTSIEVGNATGAIVTIALVASDRERRSLAFELEPWAKVIQNLDPGAYSVIVTRPFDTTRVGVEAGRVLIEPRRRIGILIR